MVGLKKSTPLYFCSGFNSLVNCMTKLTSRTERDAVKVSRGKSKQVTAAAETIKLTGGVHVEDLQNRLKYYAYGGSVLIQSGNVSAQGGGSGKVGTSAGAAGAGGAASTIFASPRILKTIYL